MMSTWSSSATPAAAIVASRRGIYDALGFARYAGSRADQLSGGTPAKLNLGLALLADPQVLLLDEPYAGTPTRAFSGADPGSRAVRPSLSACDASTMRTSPAPNSANAT